MPSGRRGPRPSLSTAETVPRSAGWASGSALRRFISSRCCGADAARFRALLWAVAAGPAGPAAAPARRLAKPIEIDPALPVSFYAAIGLRVLGGLAIRPDRLERVAAAARRLARNGRFSADGELAAIAGVEPAAMRGVLTALGYRAVIDAGAEIFVARSRRRSHNAGAGSRRVKIGEGHPFAKLRELKLA